MIAALPRVIDDPIRSFPYGAEFSLGRISGYWDDLAKDEVSYVESSELHPFVVILSHLLLVLCHLVKGFLSHFI